MAKTRLDCTSVDAARESVASLFALDVQTLREYLRAMAARGPNDLALRGRTGARVEPARLPDEVIWFHATRTEDVSSFTRHGILPRDDARRLLEPRLRALATGLRTRRPTTPPARISVRPAPQEGPFGHLFPSLADPDVTPSVPELVQRLAAEIAGDDAPRLVERFRAVTHHAVVTFRSGGAPRALAQAVRYLTLLERGRTERDAARAVGPVFDGTGRVVPPHAIVGATHGARARSRAELDEDA